MNIVSFHKRDLQLVIQYLSIAKITRLSEELRFFSANPTSEHIDDTNHSENPQCPDSQSALIFQK